MGMVWAVLTASFLLIIGTIAGLGVWTYRDAKARGLEAGMWTAIVVFIPNLIGLLLYFLIGRRRQTINCPSCGAATERAKPFCSSCGAPVAQSEHAPFTVRSVSKAPLIVALVCITLTFVLMAGVMIAGLAAQPEMFSTNNVTIGQAQTMRPGVWKLSFGYFDGEKARAIEIKNGRPRELNIVAAVQKGTVDMAVSIDGQEGKRISLNDLNAEYVWDLSDAPDNSRIVLHLYGDRAKAKINMNW